MFSHSPLRRSLPLLAMGPALILALLIPAVAQAGKKVCNEQSLYLQEVSVRERTGIDSAAIQADYLPALEQALTKKGFKLVEEPVTRAEGGVAVRIKVRAWNSKTGSGRPILDLAATVRVTEAEARLWNGEILPGEVSRMLHGKNSNPVNLAKRTANLMVEACRSGWTLKQ